MLRQVLRAIFMRPATTTYPFTKSPMPEKFRGKIIFHPERCIGCTLCMKDCPSNAIKIKKVGDKKFVAEIDIGKCIFCAQCVDTCPRKALESTAEFELANLDRNKLKIIYDGNVKEIPEK
jgi:formate hydrogenlyase subunit 6/NADH:ubiquinone oxidoreductase subunit I